jgi:NAD+ kinase
MPVTRVGLIARLTLSAALEALEEVARSLDARGCTPILEDQCARKAALGTRWRTASRDELAGLVDVVIAFGGDGTFLDAASAVAHSPADVPVLGVNLGHLGFLTEVNRAELSDALDALLAGRTRTEERMMLAGRVERGSAVLASHLALNDVVVTRGPLSRMIAIDVAVDGQFVCHVKADGLILATATGSTAYNLSAGGPIVHPSVDAVVLTPIAPHTLTNRPLVLPATAMVTLRPSPETRPSDVVVTFDGQYGVALTPHDAVTITRAPRVLRFVRTSSRSHFDMLREKLKWGHS